MADQTPTPFPVAFIRVSKISCDWRAGPLHCVAQLAAQATAGGIKAIWRNEVGGAYVTPAREAQA
ncbi:hypothetical protein HKX54_04960 [Sulfitobacter sp. M57]|uniref:hypothetical protein n=1 Tax=unclassified Sulfitobacter TaxID=196795 RepID=UPI0023E2F932|nr:MULTISPECIES: hypothetical protein [unclassified Sulfitobacter]MDF3413798.1 hypothetical protein [Sulfitobacter sp. KE5]MDF3420921.1 hypothetical protein [Sulfitobacter sp. KE43]MDF3432344.1 hypothetical protein [Sulfitobacter sp. KE42]MDF3457983.1 hypothetical protein [Sulfitobacter sp. S74]MDF3461884.1 hypothetical protein [Sulfitobacter sp. Ks18]